MKRMVLDSFYSSELRQMHAGDEFDPGDIGKDRLKEWEKRGFIAPASTDSTEVQEDTRVKLDDPDAAEKLAAQKKAEVAPLNKMEPSPANKAEPAPAEPQPARKPAARKPRKGAK